MLALGRLDGNLTLLDDAHGVETMTIQAHAPSRRFSNHMLVALSPNGAFVASVSSSEYCWKLWDVESGVLVRTGECHNATGRCRCKFGTTGWSYLPACPVNAHLLGKVDTLQFSPTGKIFATGGTGVTFLWEVKTGGLHMVLRQGARASSFSSDGTKLATARSGEGSAWIDVWEVLTGNALASIDMGRFDLFLLQFHPTEPCILSGDGRGVGCTISGDGMGVKSSDIGTGEDALLQPDYALAAITPDGRTVATVYRTLRNVVRISRWNQEATLWSALHATGHNEPISCFVFSTDSQRLVTCSMDGCCNILSRNGLEWVESTIRSIQLDAGIHSVSSGRDWVKVRNRRLAFAMGQVEVQGGNTSRVLMLDVEITEMILKYL